MKRLLFILALLLPLAAQAQDAGNWAYALQAGGTLSKVYTVVDGSSNDIDLTAKDSVIYEVYRRPTFATNTLVASFNCADDSEMTCADGSLTFAIPSADLVCTGNCYHRLRIVTSGLSDVVLSGLIEIKPPGQLGGGAVTASTITVPTSSGTITFTGQAQAVSLAASAVTGLTEEATGASGDYFIIYDATEGALNKIDWDNLPSGLGSGDNVTVNTLALTNVNFNDSTGVGSGGISWQQNRSATPDNLAAYVSANAVGAAEIDETDNYTFTGTLTVPEATVTAHEAAIDHDALTNFVSNEHIDWTASGAGTIHATNYVDDTGTDDQTAAEVSSSTTGNIEATDVDAAIAELEAEKQPLDAHLTDLSDGTLTGSKVQAAATTNSGVCELATTGETTTGTDTARCVTPDGLEDGFDGSTNVVTLGTITTGVWQGTNIDDDRVAFDDANGDWAATAIGPALEELVDANGGAPNQATGKVNWEQLVNVPAGFADGTDATGAGGSAIVFDIGDDGGDDSADVNEIATSGDTNAIFTEPSADKILIDLSNNWPGADLADEATALAANGANCSAGSAPRGVDASGAVESCTDFFDAGDGALADDDVSDDDLSALQNVVETGGGNGIPLVGDGSGGWEPANDSTVFFVGTRYQVTGSDPILSASDGVLNVSQGALQVGGVAVQTGTDDDVPESGDFGAAGALEADGTLSIDVVAAAEMADADHGDVAWSSGVATVENVQCGASCISDGEVDNDITIELATLATTVTVSDDEATNDEHEVAFTTDNANLESDGDLTYNPSTGTLTATTFSGGGLDADDVTAADVGAASANLDDTDASIEWEDAAALESDGSLSDVDPDVLACDSSDDDVIDAACVGDLSATYQAVVTDGRSLTFTGATLDADAELYTHTTNLVVISPDDYTNGFVQVALPSAATLVDIVCSTDTGTADIQLDERDEETPTSGGTDVLASALQCTTTPETDTCSEADGCADAFDNAGIADGNIISLDIDATASTPGVVRIAIKYTLDD